MPNDDTTQRRTPKGIMCASRKGGNAEIPDDFPITKCPPSRRGLNSKHVTRPRKAGRILSWEVAEALAPDAALSYDEQQAKEIVQVGKLSPDEAYLEETKRKIAKLRKENAALREE